jgi:hypothetical protein
MEGVNGIRGIYPICLTRYVKNDLSSTNCFIWSPKKKLLTIEASFSVESGWRLLSKIMSYPLSAQPPMLIYQTTYCVWYSHFLRNPVWLDCCLCHWVRIYAYWPAILFDTVPTHLFDQWCIIELVVWTCRYLLSAKRFQNEKVVAKAHGCVSTIIR